jgi:Secreted trypsin-like serine protease
MPSSATSFLACFALICGLAEPALAERQFSSVAPPAKSALAAESLSSGATVSARITLDALPPSQVNVMREKNSRASSGAVQVGIVRDVPAAQVARSTQLQWQQVEGGRAAQWRVQATGAKALRIALDVRSAASGTLARFAAADGTAVFAQALSTRGLAWGPLVTGDAAVVEIFVPEGSDVRDVDVSVARIADHFADPSLPDAIAKSQWLAQPCEVDLVCESRSDPVLAQAGSASIKLNWVDGYTAYACSGTLLNPADGSFRPYVYTAAHCLGSQAAADSLVSLWFYEKSTCGGEEARAAVQVAGGAQLLVADAATDAALLRLNRMPPEGAVYSGWDSDPPTAG